MLKIIRTKWALLSVVLIAVLIALLTQATKTGLWYDEAIEYYYSKYASGIVPGGGSTQTMYERICSTYQPPLYNWLMHIWLQIGDSEFWFRLAGILTSLAGGIGFFLAAEKLSNGRWAAVGTGCYLLTQGIATYTLQCAEYNLMLCMLCWTFFFYIAAIKEEKNSLLAGFFLFACLSVYSQYGSAFIILPLYLSLCIHFVRNKRKIRELLILSLATAVAAVLLVVFFLLPQIRVQGTDSVPHTPVFAWQNGFVDFFLSLKDQIFLLYGSGGQGNWIIMPILGMAAVLTGLALIKSSQKKILRLLLWVCLLSWILYYIAIACSFYGYNNYIGTLGTNNIEKRYGLFLIPGGTLLLLAGVYSFIHGNPERLSGTTKKGLACILAGFGIVYCAMGVRVMTLIMPRDDMREAAKTWYQLQAYDARTLVDGWSDPIFQFYLTHDEAYSEVYQKQIVSQPNISNIRDETDETGLGSNRLFVLFRFLFLLSHAGRILLFP